MRMGVNIIYLVCIYQQTSLRNEKYLYEINLLDTLFTRYCQYGNVIFSTVFVILMINRAKSTELTKLGTSTPPLLRI